LEVCRSGAIRTLCWLMLQRQPSVRAAATDAVAQLLAAADDDDDDGNNDGTVNDGGSGSGGAGRARRTHRAGRRADLCVSAVEQGVVPLVDVIAQGYYTAGAPPPSPSPSSPPSPSSFPSSPAAEDGSEPLQFFPEEGTRAVAGRLLRTVARALEADDRGDADGPRQRLLGALLAAGPASLRLNVVTAVLLLAARSPHLGRALWRTAVARPDAAPATAPAPAAAAAAAGTGGVAAAPAGGAMCGDGDVFRSLLLAAKAAGSSEWADLLGAIASLLTDGAPTTRQWRANGRLHPTPAKSGNAARDAAAVGAPTPTPAAGEPSVVPAAAAAAAATLSVKQKLGLGPTVLVEDRDVDEPFSSAPADRRIRLAAGAFGHAGSVTGTAHLSGLGDVDGALGPRGRHTWVKMACPVAAVVAEHSKELAQFLRRAAGRQGADELLRLDGPYAVWQEMFTHMLDDALLRSTVARMSDAAVAAAYMLARRYRMAALGGRYAEELSARLRPQTHAMVFQCALGRHRTFAGEGYADDTDLGADGQEEVEEGGGGGRRRGGIPVHAALARPCLLYLQAHGSELAPSAAVGFVAEVLERVFFAADEALDG